MAASKDILIEKGEISWGPIHKKQLMPAKRGKISLFQGRTVQSVIKYQIPVCQSLDHIHTGHTKQVILIHLCVYMYMCVYNRFMYYIYITIIKKKGISLWVRGAMKGIEEGKGRRKVIKYFN